MRQYDESDSKGNIRFCTALESPEIAAIINLAAVAYRGVIPGDCWHEPYMSLEKLRGEIDAGVCFSGYESAERLVGVMAVQQVRNVRLIRHAYVLPKCQGQGVGRKLLDQLCVPDDSPILIGTWAAASWAIRFYERNGFTLASSDDIAPLLRTYWNVPARQIETSVVLASPALSTGDAARLIAGASH